MKKIILILSILVIFSFSTNAAQREIMTGVNDTVLEYRDGYEPINFGRQIYVPYDVFLNNLGIVGTYYATDNVLILYNFDHIVTFDIQGRVIRDELLNLYEGEAFFRGSVLYVPAETVCDIFGLSISKTYTNIEVVRIKNSEATLTDDVFATLATEKSYYEDEVVEQTGTTSEEEPTEDEQDLETSIYPVFLGYPQSSIVDSLGDEKATFFVDNTIQSFDESLRYAYVNGHSIGIFVPNEFENDYDGMVSYLDSVNKVILNTLNFKTRLVITEDFEADLQSIGYVGFEIGITGYNGEIIKNSDGALVDLSAESRINSFITFCNRNDVSINSLNEFN